MEAPAARDEQKEYSENSSTEMGGIAKAAARTDTATWLWEAAFGWKHLNPALQHPIVTTTITSCCATVLKELVLCGQMRQLHPIVPKPHYSHGAWIGFSVNGLTCL